ncbi:MULTISPECIES: hypothetical protein [Mycobacterium]|uniref:hypothetical protein n=1 Tax=Mycobacterium TaxID=1763 RepID=UPI0005EEDACA|nr:MULTISPECIES: hypothetical protein [Mycobacterium]MCV7034899.1 type I secretion protein TolC [Mycobacterium heckeshornense]
MSDDDEVADWEQGVAEAAARASAFNEALESIAIDPISDVVVAKFDSDGFLTRLDIDPTALKQYTHTELEELITQVLRDSNNQLRDAAQALFGRYLDPASPLYQSEIF